MAMIVREIEGGVVFPVKVVPGASRSRISGLLGDTLKVNIAISPEKGKANRELVNHLAKVLGVSRSSVRVVSGLTNPRKEIRIFGISAEQLRLELADYI